MKVRVRSRHDLKCDSVVLVEESCLKERQFFGIVVVASAAHFLF